MTISNSIFVYNGQGSNPICVEQTTQNLKKKYGKNYSVIEVDGSYLAREARPALYVLPGGKASHMGQGLEQAAQKINNCVEKGSGVLAFCAGAMVASSHWEYTIPTKDTPYFVGINNPQPRYLLNLGPFAFDPTFFDSKHQFEDYLEDTVAHMADISLLLEKESCKCFWNQGPVFDAGRDDVVLAQYVFPTNPRIKNIKPSAVIHSTYGYGDIVFLGIHPELAQWSQNNGYSLSNHDLKWNDFLFEESCRLAGLRRPN